MAIQLTVMAIEYGFAGRPSTQLFYKDEVVLGRDISSDVVLKRPEISGQHAKIIVRRNGHGSEPELFIKDLGSSNGTMMGTRTLEPDKEILIQANERIIIGNYLIRSTFLDIDSPKEGENIAEAADVSAGSAVSSKQKEEVLPSPEDLPAEVAAGTGTEESRKAEQESFQARGVMAVQEEEKDMGILDDYRSDFGEQPAQDTGAVKTNKWSIFGGEAADASTDYNAEKTEVPVEPAAEKSAAENVPVADVLESRIRGKAPESAVTVTDSAININIDFDAIQLFTVAGKVSYRGVPLSNVEVRMGSLSRITSEDGRFEFRDIEDGTRYDLRAERQGYVFKCEAPSGIVSSDVEVVFSAKQLFVIRGKIMHRDTPLEGVRVEAGAWGSAITVHDGTYCIPNVPEGSGYALVAAKDGFIFECGAPSGILGQADEIVDFNARKLLTITGKITHKGFPLAGVEIDGGPIGKTITSQDGSYRFEKVPEGTDYKLVARRDGFTFGKK